MQLKIKEYINKGHLKKLTEKKSKTLTSITDYIPHHGVINVDKSGKVRVLYDAAELNNTSLNKNLLKGPDFLNNLIGILLCFMRGRYNGMADIEQMLHQSYMR